MPQVPYTGTPQVGAEDRALPSIRGDAPAAAFGANTAAALSHLGGALEKGGDELFQRALAMQQLANQTEASDANVNFMIEAGKLHADYGALQGKAAFDALPTYQQKLKELQQKIGAGLSNDMARRMYNVDSRSTMARNLFNAAGHAANEQKQWAIGSAKAQIDLDAKAGGDDPEDDVGFRSKLNRIHSSTAELAGLNGYEEGGPAERDMQQVAKSKAWAQRIIGLSRTKPFEANAMLDMHVEDLTEPDRLKVETTVRAAGRSVGSTNIANEVYNAGRATDQRSGKSLRDMEDEVRAKAKSFAPDDPILAQHAVAALQALYNQDKRAEAQEKFQNHQIVAGAIERGVKNEQELRTDPKVAAAIDALPESERLKIPGQINNFNAARDKVAHDDNFRRLLGMAQNDPEEFVNQDILSSKDLNQAQMTQLHKMQQKMKENPGGDPRVQAALNQIRGARGAELEALGIFNRNDNKEDYDKFVGALQQALDVWHDTHGKRPSYKDITETIAPDVMRQTASPGAVFGNWWPNKTPRFLADPPKEWIESTQKALSAAGRDPATTEQLQQAYAREQFKKLYGKPKTETSRVPSQ